MCIRTATNEKITVLFNMTVATLAAVVLGFLLKICGLPCCITCGVVAVSAVLTEHHLTVNPSFLLKYITLPIKEEKNEKKKTNKKK